MTTLEVKPDVGLISDDPRIVSWWEQLGVTWTDFALRSLVVICSGPKGRGMVPWLTLSL
jgi:hypothetical protein